MTHWTGDTLRSIAVLTKLKITNEHKVNVQYRYLVKGLPIAPLTVIHLERQQGEMFLVFLRKICHDRNTSQTISLLY